MRWVLAIILASMSLTAGNPGMERRVNRVMALNVCQSLNQTEALLLQVVKKDAELTQKALLAIHHDRLDLWRGEKRKLEASKGIWEFLLARASPREAAVLIQPLKEYDAAVRNAEENIFRFQEAIFALTAHRVTDPFTN